MIPFYVSLSYALIHLEIPDSYHPKPHLAIQILAKADVALA